MTSSGELMAAMSCEVKMESDELEEESKVNVQKRETENGRKRRVRKPIPAYNVDLVNSDSEGEFEKDNDPEFKPAVPAYPSVAVHPLTPPPAQLTGFTLYCHENRERVQTQHPELTEAKLSMKLANLWYSLPAGSKRSYSCRARHIESGGVAKRARTFAKTRELIGGAAGGLTEQAEPELPDEEASIAFCCGWSECDYQYEAVDECAQHITDAHISSLCYPDTESLKAPARCRWRGCLRLKRCSLPFVQFTRLSRHMAEEHVLVGKPLRPSERSQHYVPREPV